MSWWDRVLARTIQELPADAMPGRYLVGAEGSVVVNGVSARAGEHLAASPSGKWSLSADAREKRHGQFIDAELLRPLEVSSLVGIAERLIGDTGGACTTWSRLTEESPLLHPAPEQLEATRIDREIKQHGPH